jgi:imidazolonepropionase-like amidohydrolase
MKAIYSILTLCAATSLAWSFEPLSDHVIETDASRAPRLQTDGSVTIQNVTIHTATRPAFVGTVVVEGGDIKAVIEGSAPLSLAHDGGTLIDGTGKHLAPGVIDTHSHMAIAGGVNEGTLSITADVDISDSIDPSDPGIYRALAGGVTTIQCLHGSANAIGGRSEVLKLKMNATADEMRFEGAPQGIKFALGENPKGSNWGGNSSRFPATRPGVQAVYERAFTQAQAYAAEWAAYWDARSAGANPLPPRRDLRLEVLAGILDGSVNVHSHSYRADETMMLMNIAERYGFVVKTFQHVLEGYKVAAEIAKHGAGTSTFSDWWGYKIEAYDAIPQNAALLDQAGVVSTINSDSDELIRHLYHEASKSIRYAGMDPVAALRLCTLNAAIQLGVADRTGSIEVGKDADLVLMSADPMSLYSVVEMTLVDGQVEFQRTDLFDLKGLEANPYAGMTTRTGQYAEDPTELTAIVGGTVHPVDGPAIDQGTVLIHNGVIVDVGNSIEVPNGATIIDAFGKDVWPGMIALNTPLGLFEIGSVAGTDDTGEIGGSHPDLAVSMSIHPDSTHIAVTRSMGITRNQTVPRGRGPIIGQSSVIDLDGMTWEELVTKDRDMLHVRFPMQRDDMDKPKETPEPIQKLKDRFQEARDWQALMDDAKAKTAEGQALQGAPVFNAQLAALAPYALGQKPIGLHANNAQTILAAMKFAKEENLDAVLIGCTDGWKIADRIAEEGFTVVVGPVLSIPSNYDPYDARYANAAVLFRAGVTIAIQSYDDENPRNLPFAAGFASAFGLPHEEALRAVTINAATVLGLQNELGSLTPGKRADVVITQGDLFDGPTQVEAMLIDGKTVDLSNRQTQLYERYRARLEQKMKAD